LEKKKTLWENGGKGQDRVSKSQHGTGEARQFPIGAGWNLGGKKGLRQIRKKKKEVVKRKIRLENARTGRARS